MAKFKVGDKVVIARKGDSNWVPIMDKYIGTVHEIRKSYINRYGRQCYGFYDIAWQWEEEWLDPYIEEITITCHGNKTVAKMGKKVGVAKCSPDDEFDLYTGSKLALDRLFGKEVKEEKPKEEKGWNGKFIVVSTEYPPFLTVGKTYEVKDGFFYNDNLTRYPLRDKITSFEDLLDYFNEKAWERKREYFMGGNVKVIKAVE